MKFRIHFEREHKGEVYEDSIVVSGDTIKEIQEKSNHELQARGLDANKNNAWSEEIES